MHEIFPEEFVKAVQEYRQADIAVTPQDDVVIIIVTKAGLSNHKNSVLSGLFMCVVFRF
jgi:hypothetical protein